MIQEDRLCKIDGCSSRATYATLCVCKQHYQQLWRAKNAENIHSQQAQWYKEHADHCKTKSRNNYASNRERISRRDKAKRNQDKEKQMAFRAAAYLRNKKRILAQEKERYQRKKKEISAKNIEWKRNNPEKMKAFRASYRTRKKGATGTHTGKQILNLFALQRGRCAACKKLLPNDYHKDHVVPLSKGGENWITNIQLLCPSCNHKKHTSDQIDFMRNNGMLL